VLSMTQVAGRSGHGPVKMCDVTGKPAHILERDLNHGLQRLPSGHNAFPVARNCEFHRSINQSLPELWSDFSERGLPKETGAMHEDRSHTFHGDNEDPWSTQRSHATSGQKVLFVGYAEFDMDGRFHTPGEIDRLMQHSASMKYPCSRPATLDEYVEGQIQGLPPKNFSGRDVVFVGPGASGCELFHTNTLYQQKCVVAPRDPFDGAWGAASLHGRKAILCVYPAQRVRKQQSLTQFGLARSAVGRSGRLRRAGSLASLVDKTQWAHGNMSSCTRGDSSPFAGFASSTHGGLPAKR
jgi:hypothetical protein